MNSTIETRAAAWTRRAALRGDVDFTMMYVGHDALSRDLDRLLATAGSGTLLTSPTRDSWQHFSRMLHLHHSAEDIGLWPQLRAAVSDPLELATLDAMELEHASLDPLLDAITTGYADNRADDVARDLQALSRGLRSHLRHEEDDALPLLERTLGAEGWAGFGQYLGQQVGMPDMATMLPWLLDDAEPSAAATVLDAMPAPVRGLYQTVWLPDYHQARSRH